MKFRAYRLAAAAALALAASPAAAQQVSESYEFIKAVREADGNKLNKFLEDKTLRIINSKDRTSGEGALHIVAERKDSLYLRVLLAQSEINVNLTDRRGNTPLLVAVQANWEEGVTRLIRARANVNLANAGGETPLISAVLQHNEPIVRALLEAGADPDKADFGGGLTARDYAARESRYPAIAKLLKDAPKGGKRAGAVAGPRL
jgi:uncharacterized protein